jgi:hypothetical protein
MTKPFNVLAEGLVPEKVGATRRLLNFSSGIWQAGRQTLSGY